MTIEIIERDTMAPMGEMTMEIQKCQRCHHEEYIPTHQYVKFDDKVHYLCEDCWQHFRRWFMQAPKYQKNMPKVA